MKHCYTLILVILSLQLYAQPTITISNYLEIGEMEEVEYSNNTLFEPGDSGEDVTWDFSSYDTNGGTLLWEAIPPSESPYADSFPSASVAFNVPVLGGGQTSDDVYVYYEYQGDQLNLLGIGFMLTEGGITSTSYQILEENPQTIFDFPIEYGDVSVDSFSGYNYINVGGMPFKFRRTGEVTITADAYGTLTTPLGTYENVLRVKREEVLEDNFMGIPTRQVNERYTWMSANHDYLLMEMEQLTVIPFGSAPIVSDPVIYFADPGLLTSTKNHESNILPIEVYPNPVVEKLMLNQKFNTNVSYEIFNQSGGTVRNGEMSRELDVSDLPNGYFIIVIYDNQKRHVGRFFKQ